MSIWDTVDIQEALELCIDKSYGGRLELLESYLEQYESKGSLSPRQKEVLYDIMEETGVLDELDR